MLFLLFYPEIIYIVICMYIHKQEIILEVRDSLALSNIFYTFFCSEIQSVKISLAHIYLIRPKCGTDVICNVVLKINGSNYFVVHQSAIAKDTKRAKGLRGGNRLK